MCIEKNNYILVLFVCFAYVSIYIYINIFPAAYLEYRIDNFGLKKHLPESVKKLYLE